MYFNNPNQNGNFISRMNNFQIQQQLGQFKQMLDQQGNTNYEQITQNLLNSGQMSQEQFIYFSKIADQITGRNL